MKSVKANDFFSSPPKVKISNVELMMLDGGGRVKILNFYCFILIAAASANIGGGGSGKSKNVKLILTKFSCC